MKYLATLLTLACLPLSLLLASDVAATELDRVPYQLEGRSCFVEGAEPQFFCECTDVPVDIPLEEPDQKFFQLIRGMIGVSKDKDGHYILRKWSLFQVIKADGSKERRYNERIIPFPSAPLKDTAETLELSSDSPAQGTTGTRRTVLSMNKTAGTGSIRIILWPETDRNAKPKFDHTYPFNFIPVAAGK